MDKELTSEELLVEKLEELKTEMIENHVIKHEAVYSLRECLSALDNDDYDDEYEDELKDDFRDLLYVLDDKTLDFLLGAVDISQKRGEWTDRNLTAFRIFESLDMAFLFKWDDTLKLVIPDELAEIFRVVTALPDFETKRSVNKEIELYTNGLVQLYGILDFKWFTEVWNHHHKVKITEEDAEEKIALIEMAGGYFYTEDDLIIHDSFWYAEDEFDELCENTEEMDYYMPRKSEIRAYADADNIAHEKVDSLALKELKALLADKIDDFRSLDMIQMFFELFANRLYNPEHICDELITCGAPVWDDGFMAECEKLYNRIRAEQRMWDLRGFTIKEYQEKTGDKIPPMKLPRFDLIKRKGKKDKLKER
jgi:hypothetical protein